MAEEIDLNESEIATLETAWAGTEAKKEVKVPLPDILFRKLCYIFHRGFVEARLLALNKLDQQAHDLADAFEFLPGFLPDWREANLDLIRSTLQTYQKKYASSFDYVGVLDMNNDAFIRILSNW